MKFSQLALFGLATADKSWQTKEWQVQNAFFEDQEVILQNPKVRSNKQWHDCGEAPKKALNGVAVACSGAYCASVCPMGYRSQANWRVKCQDDNTWSKDGFSPCITCPDMSDEIDDLQPTGAQAQNIFVKNLPVAQFFCGRSSDTLTMKGKSYKGKGRRSKKKDVKCMCRAGQNGDPAWIKSCNWEFRGQTWYPHDVNTVSCKDENADEGNKVVYSCEHKHQGQQNVKLRCKNSLIKVVKATYGKPHPKMCYADQVPGQTSMKCATSMDHTDAVAEACDGKSSCRYHGTNKIAGDPCFGVEKHTEIEYTCEPKYCIKVISQCSGGDTGKGSDILLFHNGIHIDTLESGFNQHETCLPMSQVNKYPDQEEDIWELRSTGSDSVCIDGILVNGKAIDTFQKDYDNTNVWIGPKEDCYELLEVTKSVKFQGRKIIRSFCTKDPQCSERSIPGQCDNEIMILDPDHRNNHYSGLYRLASEFGLVHGRPVWKHVEHDYKLLYGRTGGWSIHTLKDGAVAWSGPNSTPTKDPMCPEPMTATGGYGFKIACSTYCIKATSSNSPTCVVNPDQHEGSEINVYKNGELIDFIPARFSEYENCLRNIDVEKDVFELKYTTNNHPKSSVPNGRNDGVCLTGLFLNDEAVLVGAGKDQAAFWIEDDRNGCSRTERSFAQIMSTQNIKFRNGEVIESECTVPPACRDQDPCVYVPFTTEYHYKALYDNANDYDGFIIDASDFTNDIHIGLSKHDVHEDKKWEIVIGGWKGTQSVIRSANQTPKSGHVKVNHSVAEYEALRSNFKIMFNDGSITVINGNTNEIFMQYTDDAIVKSELRFLLASGGFGGSGTFNTIKPINAWTVDTSINCWHDCEQKGGACDVCNSGNQQGYCCRGDGAAGNGDCPQSAINAIPMDAQNYHTCVVKEEFCIRVTSSNSPLCIVNPGSHKGSPIEITQNGNLINTIPSGFSDHEFCLPSGFFDAETDVFEFKYTGGRRNDGVCVTSLFMNGQQILVGEHEDQAAFWIENDRNGCTRTDRSLAITQTMGQVMSTQNIKIQNGEVIESECTVPPACEGDEPCLYVPFNTEYHYTVLYNNANEYAGFQVDASDFTNDIHIGLSKHDVHEDKKWEIVIGGWRGTKSVIRSANQSPKAGLVSVSHTKEEYEALINNFKVLFADGSITIVDADTNEIFMQYKSASIVKSELRFLLASGGFGGSGSFNSIKPISAWTADPGFNCWHPCEQNGGLCDACNSGNQKGYCCRGDGAAGNGDCPVAAIAAIPDDSQNFHMCVVQEEYCIRLTSSNSDECVVNPGSHTGSPITLTQNGNLIHTVPSRFSDDEYCIPAGLFDAENDIFELKYTGGNRNNGVCVTGLHVDGEQILLGANGDQKAFWIENDRNGCSRTERSMGSFSEIMSTQNVKFQNGKVIESECTVLPLCDNKSDCTDLTFDDSYNYQAVLSNLNELSGFSLTAPDFSHDIHIGLSKHDVHEDKKWEIVLGGWQGTKTVIRNKNQSPKNGLVRLEHTVEDFNEWKADGIIIKINDGSIKILDAEENTILEYEDEAIVEDELRFVLISGGFAGSGTIEKITPISNWQFHAGNCWHDCNQTAGKCDACNQGDVIGYCCRPDWSNGNGNRDCPNGAILNISPFKGRHHCFFQP